MTEYSELASTSNTENIASYNATYQQIMLWTRMTGMKIYFLENNCVVGGTIFPYKNIKKLLGGHLIDS